MSRKRVPLNQNECTADFGIGVPFEQNLHDLASSNIKTVLSEKADELENSLSTAKMKLSCEVENVEVHNAGEEIVNN